MSPLQTIWKCDSTSENAQQGPCRRLMGCGKWGDGVSQLGHPVDSMWGRCFGPKTTKEATWAGLLAHWWKWIAGVMVGVGGFGLGGQMIMCLGGGGFTPKTWIWAALAQLQVCQWKWGTEGCGKWGGGVGWDSQSIIHEWYGVWTKNLNLCHMGLVVWVGQWKWMVGEVEEIGRLWTMRWWYWLG